MTIGKEDKKIDQSCCPKTILEPVEPPITSEEARKVESIFKILASDTRLRLLHELTRAEELCVCDLATAIKMSPQAISNHLQRMLDRNILSTRRSGNMIYYRVIDEDIVAVLKNALDLARDAANPENDNLQRMTG